MYPPKRYRPRRIADHLRKRAAKACFQCRHRKSKCTPSSSESCIFCVRHSLRCDLPELLEAEKDDHKLGTSRLDHIVSDHEADAASLQQDLSVGVPRPADDFFTKLKGAFRRDVNAAPGHHYTADQIMFGATTEGRCQLCLGLGQPHVLHFEDERMTMQQAMAALPPLKIVDFLLNTCASYATDTLFYCDQTDLRERLHQLYKEDYLTDEKDRTFLSLAFATFALASQWTASMSHVTSSEVIQRERQHGMRFLQQARSLLPALESPWDLESIQASLVIGVYLLSMCAVTSLRSYFSFAIRKAIDSGLHMESEDPRVSALDKEIRTRVWWSIFSLECSTALKLNLPRSISGRIATTAMPKSLPYLDARQLVDNSLCQASNARLIKILDDVFELGTPRNASYRDIESICRRLKAWKSALPAELQLQNSDSSKLGFRTTLHLHLNYRFAWIAVGKSALIQSVQHRLNDALTGQAVHRRLSRNVQENSATCVKAASEIIHIVARLKDNRPLVKHSFTDFQGCSIATIVLLISGIVERSLGHENEVAFGLRCLREMAEDNPSASMGYEFVKKIKELADEAAGQYQAASTAAGSDVAASPTDEVANWLNWIAGRSSAHDGSSISRTEPEALLPYMPRVDPDWRVLHAAVSQDQDATLHADTTQLPSQVYSFTDDEGFQLFFEDHATLMDLTGLEILGLVNSP